MSRKSVLCVIALGFAVACSDELPQGSKEKPDSPIAPSFNVAPTASNSTICKAFTREMVSAKAAAEKNPAKADLRASASALEAMTADVCN